MENSEPDRKESEHYFEIVRISSAEIKVKGSRFIAYAIPARTVAECNEILAAYQRQYHDATHVCFSYSVGVGDQRIYRYSDAGEPAGSAGAPIYQVLQGRNLTNLILLVIRYFGGTKLGLGGLVRAYGDAAKAALETATIVEKVITGCIRIRSDYQHLNSVMRSLNQFDAKILHQNFAETIELVIEVAKPALNQLQKALVESSSGQVKWELVDCGD